MEIKEAFKFCPRCNAQFDKKTNLLKCPTCMLSYYLNPKAVQSVILTNDDGEILFTVRAIEPKKGYLDFPGGFVEEDEDFEETTRREVKEELGIEVENLEYLCADKDEYLFEDILYKTSGVAYLAKLPKNAKIKPADDVSAVEFYKIDNIPMDRLAFPSMQRMIERLKARL